MVVVIKYNAGNILSVTNALTRINAKWVVSDDEEVIKTADHVIFPGVGSAKSAMEYLKEKGLDKVLKEVKVPFLGICLGMQLMASFSEEGDVPLLNIIPSSVTKFDCTKGDKVPQIGWNVIEKKQSPIFKGLPEESYFYFVHSYFVPYSEHTIASCTYAGTTFSAAIQNKNYYGVQFHPEKSGMLGELLLKNFLELTC